MSRKSLVMAALAAVLMLVVTPAMARDSVELVIGDQAVEGEGATGTELDMDAQSYSVRYFNSLGASLDESHRVAWDLGGNLERLSGAAWCVDGLVRLKAGNPRFHGYGALGIGGVVSDVESTQELVTTEVSDSLNPSGARVQETEVVGTVETAEQSIGLTYTANVGLRGYLDKGQTVGFFAEYSARWGLVDGSAADVTTGPRVGFILPAGP